MKDLSRRVAVLWIVLGLYMFAPVDVQAAWQLYDNFDSGTIESELWNVDTSGGTVSVVNKMAKFVQTNPASRTRLSFTNPESIKGVKVKIKVENFSGDLRARIAGYAALTPDGAPVWQQLEVRPQSNCVQAYGEVSDPVTEDTLYAIFYNQFTNPVKALRKWFTISAIYAHPNPNKYSYWVKDQSTATFTFPKGTFRDGGKSDLYIGLKSRDGVAKGTVYFDDVYVLK